MLNLSNIQDWITQYILQTSIIYIGVGTYYDNSDNKCWNYEENQQFPPFLHDFKSKNINVPILIILIDPAFDPNEMTPFVVNSNDQFYSHSWTKSTKYPNLFNSSLGIDVITISDKVEWGNETDEEPKLTSFEQLMVNLSNIISEPKINSLLFYHEFTGSNIMRLENIVKNKTIAFDSNKICIDITRGSNVSCFFNLSNPEFYPIISSDEHDKLIYVNPFTLPIEQKKLLIAKYKKFTDGFENLSAECNFHKNKPNNLFDTNPDIILCFQIMKVDKIIFNIISDGLIPLIRYLSVFENTNYSHSNNKIWFQYLDNLLSYIGSLNLVNENLMQMINYIENAKSGLYIIGEVNYHNVISSFISSDEIIDDYRNMIINQLFIIIKCVLIKILFKYKINIITIEDFIKNLKEQSDIYNMVPYYKNFISCLSI